MKKFIGSILVLSCMFSFCYASDVLAVVNGKDITTEVAPVDFKGLDKQSQEKIVNKLIEKRLASDYAFSTGITKSAEYKKVLEHILNMSQKKSEKQKQGNLAEIVKKESIQGYTKEQLESKKGLLAFDFLLTQKAAKMQPTQAALKKFYEGRKYMYDTPAQIELLDIVVNKEALAQEIISKVSKAKNKLEEFSKLAKEYSLAPSKEHFGYFGKIAINELNDELKPLLSDKKRGYLSEKPAKTVFGYEIFYVLNDIPEFKSTFEAVQEQVKDEYIKQAVKTWAMEKIKELKSKADIKILL